MHKLNYIYKFLKVILISFTLYNVISNVSFGTTILEAFDLFVEATGPNSAMNTGNSTNNGNGSYSYDNFRNLLSSKTDNAFCIISAGNNSLVSSNIACYYYAGQSFDNNYARLNSCTWFGQKNNYSFNNTYSYNGGGSSNYNTAYNGKFLYLFLENGQIVNTNIEIPPTFEFIPNGSQVIYEDYVNLPYANKYSYSVNQWSLGQIVDFGDYTKMEIYLGSQKTHVTYKSTFINFGDGHWTDIGGDLGLSYDNFLYFPSRLLTYNEVWNLWFYLYLNDTYEHDDVVDYNFLFLPINSVVSGDNILSSGSGDFTNQDMTNNIVSALTDTNLPSGDKISLNDLPSIEASDPSNDFFTWLLEQILLVLNDNTEQTLVIPLLGENFEIRSDYFKLTNEPLKTFIQTGWWFIVGVPFLKYIRRSIEKLKGGEIPTSDDKSDLLGNVL